MPVYRIIASGRVQGVAFRFTIKNYILEQFPHLHGFICNLSNGDVELMVQASAQELRDIEQACQTRVKMARVDQLVITELSSPVLDLPHPFCVLKSK